MFGLQTSTCLGGTPVLHLDRFATDEEFSAIRVNGNQSIGLVEVNTDRQYSLWRGDFKRKCDTSDEFAVSLENHEAVNLFGMLKGCLEVIGNRVGEMLAPAHRPDRECPILAEIRITPEGGCPSPLLVIFVQLAPVSLPLVS